MIATTPSIWRRLAAAGLLSLAALPAEAETTDPPAAIPDTPESLRAELARRRAESPPLDVVLRVARGAATAAEEETEEEVIAIRWSGAPGDGAEPETACDVSAAMRPARAAPSRPESPLLRDLDPPLLRPAALRVLEMRQSTPRSPPRPRDERPAARRPFPGPGDRHVVVGPDPLPPRRATLPDEYGLARPSLRLLLDHPQGPVEAVLDPVTLYVERLAWGAGRDRVTVLVESVRPATEGSATASAGAGRKRGDRSSPRPRPSPLPPVRGILRVTERTSDDPRRTLLLVEGFAPGLADGEVVEVRALVVGEEIERGPWRREAGRRHCAAQDCRIEAEIEMDRAELAAGHARIDAVRPAGGGTIAEHALPSPAETWRLLLQAESRAAGRILDAMSAGRPADARTLAALARGDPWRLLPATRRAIEARLQALASAAPAAIKDVAPVRLDDIRGLLGREARWAVLERLTSPDMPPGPRDLAAIRRTLPDLAPAPDDLDRAMEAVLEALDPRVQSDGTTDPADSVRSLRLRLRGIGPP
jgi:hypothetical protein